MRPLPPGIDADYLTQALLKCGAIQTGHVREASVLSSQTTMLSQVLRLRLAYRDASEDAPHSLILKTSLPQDARPAWNSGPQEAEFYVKVGGATPAGLLPRCFDAVCGPDGTSWHLMLEDLTDTHDVVTTWPLPPSEQASARIIQARARFHAAWWDHAGLGTSAGTWSSLDDLQGLLGRFRKVFAKFIDRRGDLVTPERRKLYERMIDAAPGLNARYYGRQNLTIVQGDGHFWNCFLAKTGDGVKFFDWDFWRIDVGTDDLAYMIAMHWYPDRRHRFERGLLDRYHETLMAHGVSGYSRASLDDDYRLSVLWQMMMPVWHAAAGVPPHIWWNNYERIMMAVDDLNCRELLR